MLDTFAVGFEQMLNWSTMLYILAGVCVGILFGASPGLTTSMGMAFSLPLTFILEPVTAMALLVGLYIGGASGGLITAMLINIPGTPACVATTFDGYPMAQNGEPGKALGIGIISSFVGGMLSLPILFFASPYLAKVALQFGPCEYFAVSFFSLTLIAGLAGKSMLKGLASGLVGLMLASIGQAPLDATPRFTFGIESFNAGLQMLCALIGVYAVTELLKYAENNGIIDMSQLKGCHIKGFGVKLSELKDQIFNMVRSALIGIGIGILPGIGGGTSNIIAYSVAKNQSKYPEKFGTGIKDGIVASETANNAVTGGALIPLLTLGIPGDAATAILLAALMIHGITPGPLLFQNNGDLIYGIFAALIIANLFMICVEFLGMRLFLKLVTIPKYYLLSAVFVLCAVGAFGQNNRIFDVWSILLFGLVGYFLIKFDFSLTPLVMGFILGPIVETNLLRGLMFTEGNFWAFFSKPIAAAFLILSLVYLVYVIRKTYLSSKTTTK
ncbi:MAG: tripartite tricarboxylate transporter permease [Eubacteriales bacterium]|jgi:putative tricarboxylic transport membrane protein